MEQTIELNEGEVKIRVSGTTPGKITFNELGLTDDRMVLEGGFLRLVLELDDVDIMNYYAVPTIEVGYIENTSETHWQCEFNGETILDKMDHHGNSTILLLDRNKLESLEHRHENTLIIHAEFPELIHISTENSSIHLFK